MASNSADSLTKRHEQEIAHLQRGRYATLRIIVLASFILVASVFTFRVFTVHDGEATSLRDARDALISVNPEWGTNFVESQQWYADWLARHGTAFEFRSFNRFSQALIGSAESFSSSFNLADSPSIASRMYLSLHGGLLRVIFILIASFRLWLVIIGTFIYFGLRSLKAYTARDALGMTGNGRVFFSGIRVALDKVTADGAPAEQVTGLACPGTVSFTAAKLSTLTKLLERFNAVTTTNIKLAGILEFYKEYPAFVAQPDEEAELEGFFEGVDLLSNTITILEGALTLHRAYQGNGDLTELPEVNHEEVLQAVQQGQKVSAADNAAITIESFDHVLTPKLKQALALLDAASIATVILALEAGKSMAYCFEGGKWIRKSNFPQLCARSVLHSIPEFALEYDFDLRMTIRRALIFGSRSSVFAPVKFPLDFRDESRAARQWVEILMATPPELTATTNEVQLLGLIAELQQKWEKVLFDGAEALDPAVIDQVFATPQNLIFMPMTKLVQLMRRFIDQPTIEQLESLISIVSQEQRRKIALYGSGGEGEDERRDIPSYERIFQPFTPQQIKSLIDIHGIPAEDVRDWSSLRVILHSYGWLGRRVGERSVPESSVICAAFAVEDDFPGANPLGLIGHVGMVPLRATRLEERWGKVWASRFVQVGLARMAETRKDFELLLAGNDDEGESDSQVNGGSAAQGSGGL